MGVTLSDETRTRLDQHLDAVDAALASVEKSRQRRRAVVDDLESQILEMLAGRSPHPGLSDLDAVLQQLDPPSAYANSVSAGVEDAVPPAPATVPPMIYEIVPPPRYSRTAIAAAVCIVLSIFPPLRIFNDPTGVSSPMFALLGTVLGWVSIFKISHSEGTLRGINLAFICSFFYIFLLTVGGGVVFAMVMLGGMRR